MGAKTEGGLAILDRVEKKKIGELLIQNGYIDSEHLEEALEVQKSSPDRICNILIDLGHLSETGYFEFMSASAGIGSIDLSGCEVDLDLIRLIRHQLARRLEIVPIGKMGRSLTVAMVCPLDEAAKTQIEDATGLKVMPLLSTRSHVLKALEGSYEKFKAERTLFRFQRALAPKTVAKFVAGIETLPTLPSVLSEVSSITRNADLSIDELTSLISTDCSLSARILKLSNLAAFGFSRKISSIRQAVGILGLKEAQRYAVSVPVFHPGVDRSEFDYRVYREHSVSCARLARFVSLNLKICRAEDAYVAGLLHDVGKIALAVKKCGPQGNVSPDGSAAANSGQQKLKESLDISHTDVGYCLGENWNLPRALTNSILYHHNPDIDPAPGNLSCVVFLANIFCKMGPSELKEDITFDWKVEETLEALKLSKPAFGQTLKAYAHTRHDFAIG
jgi:HD-like signal output (HDOD) protein